MYGSAGRPAPDLHALHFPVGGRRFRPTLEEFLLFLDRENLFDNWKDGLEAEGCLTRWRCGSGNRPGRRPGSSPSEAVGALEALGYRVTAPGAGRSAD